MSTRRFDRFTISRHLLSDFPSSTKTNISEFQLSKETVDEEPLETLKRSFLRFGVSLWNEIPRRIRDLPKKEFKGEIRRLLNIW